MKKARIFFAAIGMACVVVSCPKPVDVSRPASEGTTVTPVSLTPGTAHGGTVGDTSDSFYSFPTAAFTNYTIAVTNTEGNFGWTLYSDAAFTSYFDSCDNYDYIHDETKTSYFLTAATTYYLRVSSYGDGGTFTVLLTGVP